MVIAILGVVVVGFIVGQAWPKHEEAPQPEPEKHVDFLA